MMFAMAVLGFLIAFGLCASIVFTMLLPLFLVIFVDPSVAVWTFLAGCVLTISFISLVRWYYDSYIEKISNIHKVNSQLQSRSRTGEESE